MLCVAILIASSVFSAARAKPASDTDHSAYTAIFQALDQDCHHDLKGIVILDHDELVAEHYFNGDGPDTLHDIRSATKSITATLVGQAIARGAIHNVDVAVAEYLPALSSGGRSAIRIEDLLTMRSGLDADDEDAASPGNETSLDAAPDWLQAAYAVPMKRTPGHTYVYASINAFLAGFMVEQVSHESLALFARQTLFGPLGIQRFEWREVRAGHNTGQGNLRLTTRDLARIGQLYLDGGVYRGRQIVPAHWVAESVAEHVAIAKVDPYADSYGYMWYSKTVKVDNRAIKVHFASGNGGNKIYLVPGLRLVVAITSSAYNHGYGQRRSQAILLRVLAARAGQARVIDTDLSCAQ